MGCKFACMKARKQSSNTPMHKRLASRVLWVLLLVLVFNVNISTWHSALSKAILEDVLANAKTLTEEAPINSIDGTTLAMVDPRLLGGFRNQHTNIFDS